MNGLLYERQNAVIMHTWLFYPIEKFWNYIFRLEQPAERGEALGKGRTPVSGEQQQNGLHFIYMSYILEVLLGGFGIRDI